MYVRAKALPPVVADAGAATESRKAKTNKKYERMPIHPY